MSAFSEGDSSALCLLEIEQQGEAVVGSDLQIQEERGCTLVAGLQQPQM